MYGDKNDIQNLITSYDKINNLPTEEVKQLKMMAILLKKIKEEIDINGKKCVINGGSIARDAFMGLSGGIPGALRAGGLSLIMSILECAYRYDNPLVLNNEHFKDDLNKSILEEIQNEVENKNKVKNEEDNNFKHNDVYNDKSTKKIEDMLENNDSDSIILDYNGENKKVLDIYNPQNEMYQNSK